MPYNHAPHKQRDARSTMKKSARQKSDTDHWSKHEQKASSKICTKKTNPAPDPPTTTKAADKAQHQANGTDYRYTVEFSKNGHAPIPALRTAWGATFINLLGPVRSVKLPVPQCLPAIAGGADAPRRCPRLEAVAPLTSTRQHR